jgi:hypothetical protein
MMHLTQKSGGQPPEMIRKKNTVASRKSITVDCVKTFNRYTCLDPLSKKRLPAYKRFPNSISIQLDDNSMTGSVPETGDMTPLRWRTAVSILTGRENISFKIRDPNSGHVYFKS